MHLYKQYLSKPHSVKLYSEQDVIVKFWPYVFEGAFSNSGLCLHWGDTKPGKAKKNEKIDMKTDLLVLYCSNTKKADISVGGCAKKAFPRKLYIDKLKQAALSKYHLNTPFLSAVPFISLIQIMGFECYLYTF